MAYCHIQMLIGHESGRIWTKSPYMIFSPPFTLSICVEPQGHFLCFVLLNFVEKLILSLLFLLKINIAILFHILLLHFIVLQCLHFLCFVFHYFCLVPEASNIYGLYEKDMGTFHELYTIFVSIQGFIVRMYQFLVLSPNSMFSSL
ncbi:hypothetical protein ACJX0J_012962 [Zea mays]